MGRNVDGSKKRPERVQRVLHTREKLRAYKIMEMLALAGLFALIAIGIIIGTQIVAALSQ